MASIVISHKYSHTRPDGLVVFQGTCFNTDFLPSPDLGPFLGNLDKVIPQLDIIDLVPKTLQAGTNYDGYVPDANMYIIGASMGANTDSVGLLGDTQDSMWIVRAYQAVYSPYAPIGGVTIIPDTPYPVPTRQRHYESPWGGASGGTYWTPKTANMGYYGIAFYFPNYDYKHIEVFPSYMHYFDGAIADTRWFGFNLHLFTQRYYNSRDGVCLEWSGPKNDPDSPVGFYDSELVSWVNGQESIILRTPQMGSVWEFAVLIGFANRPVYWYPPYMPERDVSGGRNYGGGYPSLQGLSSDCYNWLVNKWL